MKKVEKILLVQDDLRSRNTIKGILERNGIPTVAAGSGTHGIQMVEKNKFNLIIIIDHLEDMPFHELAGLIKGEREIANVIVCSSKYDEDEKSDSLQAGASEYMELSTDRNPLINVIKRILNLK